MTTVKIIIVLFGCVFGGSCNSDARLVQGTNVNLGEALRFLRQYDAEASDMCFRVSTAQWNYATNLTDANKRRMVDEQMLRAKFDKSSWRRAIKFDWTRLPDPMTRRQLKFLVTKGRASLTDEKFNEARETNIPEHPSDFTLNLPLQIYHLVSEMKDTYNHVRICPYNNHDYKYCDLILEPDVRRLMAYSRNPSELLHVWKEFHDKTGPPVKNKFMRYVQLANQAARMTGFLDAGDQLKYEYEDEDVEFELDETWRKLLPLYRELFTYVRRKLFVRYGGEVVRLDGPIPAHLLGDVWGQEWSKLADVVMPYHVGRQLDVTDELLRQSFTPSKMFQMAEEFYTSLGLKPMPPEFWRHSLVDKPNDRTVQCTGSAWDFCNKIDYRIKLCTEVDTENLIRIHHEMAHVQYYLQYSEQPYLYRFGANPGFHEGVSNAMTLSAFNPGHMHRVGLFSNGTDTYELNMNFLMAMALKKLAYAPFALLVDKWRYKLYKDGVQNMNANWWELRLEYQGIVPPVPRTEAHLDAASKRHVIADVPYMQYYVALLLEFQIHESLCSAIGHTAPLHTCDIYRSKEAGRILGDGLKLGRSRHWKDVLRIISRGHTDQLSADSMLKYFKPLEVWLRTQNRDEVAIGWIANVDDTALFQPMSLKSGGRLLKFNFVIVVPLLFPLVL